MIKLEANLKISVFTAIYLVALTASVPGNLLAHGSHHHGKGEEESAFSFVVGVGAGMSASVTDPPKYDPNTAVIPANLMLHGGDGGGDDHTGGSGDSGGSKQSAPAAYAMAAVSYQLSRHYSAGLGLNYDFSGHELGDPSIGLNYSTSFSKKLALIASVSFTLPTSTTSQKTYKTTSVSVSAGPRYKIGKFTLGASASMTSSWYSKTVIVENQIAPLSAAALHGDGETDEGGEEADNIPPDSGNREFNRYSARGTVSYAISKHIALDSSIGLSLVKLQFGDPYWSADITLLQISYLF